MACATISENVLEMKSSTKDDKHQRGNCTESSGRSDILIQATTALRIRKFRKVPLISDKEPVISDNRHKETSLEEKIFRKWISLFLRLQRR